MARHPHAYTYTDLLEMPEGPERHEIVDGELFVTASPSVRHQKVWRICARFMLGNWPGVFEDQHELGILQGQDDRDLPVPFVLRDYTSTALCHELRGERERADRYVSVLETAQAQGVLRGAYKPTLARLYAQRGMHDATFDIIAVETGGHSGCPDEV